MVSKWQNVNVRKTKGMVMSVRNPKVRNVNLCGEALECVKSQAYIPLRRHKVVLGPGVGLAPQRHYFALGIPTGWYLNMLKVEFPPTQNIKVAFSPTQNPNASQWNIGCVGSLALGLCVGHVHFIFFVLISFALGSRRKRSFQWNMGFTNT